MKISTFYRDAIEESWRRIKDAGDDNVTGIGLGIALKSNQLDLGRPTAIRFYVNKKRKQKNKFDVPETITFSLGHKSTQGEACTPAKVTLPTDVYELPQVFGSGQRVAIPGNGSVTSGLVVRWNEKPITPDSGLATQTKWGILTVAHDFSEDRGTPWDVVVGLEEWRFRGNRLIQSSPATSGIDVTLIAVNVEDLLEHSLIADLHQEGRDVKQWQDLVDDGGKAGLSRQQQRDVAFNVVGTLSSRQIDNVGTVEGLLHVQGARQAFVPGTSGAVLEVLEAEAGYRLIPAALQVGADRQLYREALGQSLEWSLGWVRRQLILLLSSQGKYLAGGELAVVSVF